MLGNFRFVPGVILVNYSFFLAPGCVSCTEVFSLRILDHWNLWPAFAEGLLIWTGLFLWCFSQPQAHYPDVISSVDQCVTKRKSLKLEGHCRHIVIDDSRFILDFRCDTDPSLPFHSILFVEIRGSQISVRFSGNSGIYLIIQLDYRDRQTCSTWYYKVEGARRFMLGGGQHAVNFMLLLLHHLLLLHAL